MFFIKIFGFFGFEFSVFWRNCLNGLMLIFLMIKFFLRVSMSVLLLFMVSCLLFCDEIVMIILMKNIKKIRLKKSFLEKLSIV